MSVPSVPEGGVPFGRYRLLERIGAGGMAVVYRAASIGPEGGAQELVIKRVLPELSRDKSFSAMLVAEARISSRLHHPAIVCVYEFGRVGQEYYLAMEHVDGVDVVQLLNYCARRREHLPVGVVTYLVAQLAGALAYAHDLCDHEERPLGIVHRDVTPSNVMVTRQGGVKLLDFGVAKAAEHVRDERTRTGTLKGKVNYLSPESADGRPVDRRSDVFSLGIVFHECLTLKRLFKAEGDLATLRLVREASVAAPSTLRPEVPPELDRIVLRMLARSPDDRYPDCKKLLEELQPLLSDPVDQARALAQLVLEVRAARAARAPTDAAEPTDGHTPVQRKLPSGLVQRRAGILLVATVGVGTFVTILGGALVLRGRQASRAEPQVATVGTPVAPATVPATTTTPTTTTPPTSPPRELTGVLSVTTDAPAARFLFDGKPIGGAGPRLRTSAAAGDHELVVTAPRRKPFAGKVHLSAGATLELAVKMEKLRTEATRPTRGENYLVNPFGGK